MVARLRAAARAAGRAVKRMRLWPRAYNLARRVLPRPARAWVKAVVLRQPLRLPDFEDILRRAAASPSPGSAVSSGSIGDLSGSRYDVVYFPILEWTSRVQRSQHLCAQFADHGHRVYYVRTSGDRSDGAPGDGTWQGLRVLGPGVYDLPLAGLERRSLYSERLDAGAVARLRGFLADFQQAAGLRDVVCMVALPFWGPLAVRLKEALGWTLVYDCVDEHGAFATNDPTMVASEIDLATASDLVVTTARALYDRLSRFTPRCVLIPNAGDFEHFNRPAAAPARYATLSRPVIGYVGAIAEWFDGHLMAHLARQRPAWSFVLIGSTYGGDVWEVQGLPNVHLLGELPYADLPGHLQQFDACLIPFKVMPLTKAAHPVKLYEYLSAGKPVVTVPLPEVAPFVRAGLAYEGSDPDQFLAALEQALREDGPDCRAARTAVARRHTWADRYRALERAVAGTVPRASIIVVTHNRAEITSLCLQSLWAYTSYPNFEVIVVDNASDDGTVEMIQQMQQTRPNLRLVRHAANLGFAAATNRGLLAASGDVLVLLNNDTVVTRGWLGGLLRHLLRDRTIGMVGPVTNFAGNEARIDVSYGTLEEMHAFAAAYTRRHAGCTRDLAMLGMFCVAFRREALQRVGLLDERFGIGLFEDDDYAWRVRALGDRLVCAEDVFVHHFGRSSIRALDGPAYDALFEQNRQLFERKWNTVWERHRTRAPSE